MKTAIVFGATSGIGKEISELLLKDGYKVAITGRRLEKLEALKNQYSNQVYIAQNDIQKVDEVEKVFNDVLEEFSTIDLIIQSSGVGYINPTLAWSMEEETIHTNVVGVTKLYDLSFNLFRKQGFWTFGRYYLHCIYTRKPRCTSVFFVKGLSKSIFREPVYENKNNQI